MTGKPVYDGGAAFPKSNTFNPQFRGMSLRDYFAAKVMQAWLSTYTPEDGNPFGDRAMAELARSAYGVADSMLKERSKDDDSERTD